MPVSSSELVATLREWEREYTYELILMQNFSYSYMEKISAIPKIKDLNLPQNEEVSRRSSVANPMDDTLTLCGYFTDGHQLRVVRSRLCYDDTFPTDSLTRFASQGRLRLD